MSYSFINAWSYTNKSWGKHAVKLRIGRLTIFDFYLDREKKLWALVIMNFGIRKNHDRAPVGKN